MSKLLWILFAILLAATALYGLGGAIIWCVGISLGIVVYSLVKTWWLQNVIKYINGGKYG